MKKNIIGLAVAATLGMTSFAAAAEDMYRGAWYLVPGVSYLHTDSDLDANNGGGAFIRLGKELSDHWDIQGGLSYDRASEDISNTDLAKLGATNGSGRYRQTALNLDALYMFSRDKFRPFLLAGLGAARNNVDYKVNSAAGNVGDSKSSWLANVGVGMQYLFSDSFGLQADLRHQWTRADVPKYVGAASNNNNRTETIGNTLLNLGGIFRFGAPAPVVAEPAPEPAPIAAAEPAPAPAPEPAPAPAPAPACKPSTETITVSAEKLFGFDKASLKEEGKAALDEAAAKIKANPEIKAVIVTGHTDRIGSDAYNQKLSERRAKQVADYLVAQGVDSSIITAEGKGETQPVVECKGNKATKKLIQCLQPNRRVEIRAEGQKETGCN